MKTVSPADLSLPQLHHYLQHAIAPRPICFASTTDAAGRVNLSPFSFFNLFSTDPPLCIFSPSRRVRDNTTKHTLENILEVPEVVINVVNYAMVQQTSLASTEYDKGVNEFIKAGFTPLTSVLVRPPRVAESPVQLECRVQQVIPLGDTAGAGNLILARIELMHIKEEVLDSNGNIDQIKLDLVARLGGDWYCRVTGENLFKVAKPLTVKGMGIDAIPAHIRNSAILSGNNLGQLGNVAELPQDESIEAVKSTDAVRDILESTIGDAANRQLQLHLLAKKLLDEGDVTTAWQVLLAG